MLCPVLKKMGLSSDKIHLCVFGRKEWENEAITKLMSSITKEGVSQEEFGRGQWHYSCQCGMFMALK